MATFDLPLISWITYVYHLDLNYFNNIVTFFSFLKYEFGDCKQSKNKYVFASFKLLIIRTILCATVQTYITYMAIITTMNIR